VRTLSGRRSGIGAGSLLIAVGAGHVWVTNARFGTIMELKASNGRWVQTLVPDGADRSSSLHDMAVDGTHVWLTMGSGSYPSGAVIEFNARNGQWIRTLTGTGFDAEGPIVANRTNVWVICSRGSSGRSSLTEFSTK
jgi:hypothetical protein